jgi:opacity protein-like surface antigen
MKPRIGAPCRRSAIVLLVCVGLGGVAGRAAAQAGPAADAFGYGKQEIGLVSGYGVGWGAFGSQGTELADVRPVPLLPRWGVGITNPLGGESWYRGNLSLILEGVFLFNQQPRDGCSAGGALSFRYNLLRGSALVPYAEAGAGMTHLDFDLPSQRDGFNFLLQLGAGAHWFIRERTALTVAWRFLHISNADSRLPNFGINMNLFLIGPTFFVD